MIKNETLITIASECGGGFSEGDHITCQSCPEKTYLITKATNITLWIIQIFKVIGQYDYQNKNPLIWFFERLF